MRSGFIILIIISLFSCRKNILYNPNEINPSRKNLNEKNIRLIESLPPKDSFKFVFSGDTQLAYDDTEAFIAHINTLPDISFIIFNGDFAEHGLNNEFNLFAKQLELLKVPYVTAIGNHDMLANGRAIYKLMFGEENFSFNYSKTFFVLMNTNSGEVGFDGTIPDLNRIQNILAGTSGYSNVFFISHVPPFSSDFDPKLEAGFNELLLSAPNARISLHGHLHNYSYTTPYNNNFPYLVAPAIYKRKYIIISVMNNNFKTEVKSF